MGTAPAKDREYFLTIVRLCANLCVGANETTVPHIANVIPYEIACACVKARNLPSQLRGAFCDILLHAFVDIAPHSEINYINLTRVWSDLTSKSSQPHVNFDINSNYDYSIIKRFVMQYIKANTVQVVNNADENALTLTVLILLRKMFSFGFFYNLEEMCELSLPLVHLLDGRTDVMTLTKGPQMSDGRKPRNLSGSLNPPAIGDRPERFEKNDKTWIVMETKLEICRILEMMCDIRLDLRLTEILYIYKVKVEEEELRKSNDHDPNAYRSAVLPANSPTFTPTKIKLSKESLRRINSRKEIVKHTKEVKNISAVDLMKTKIEKCFRLLDLNRRNLLIPVLLDLLHYRYPDLAASAAQLLIRQFFQRSEVKKSLYSVQILISSANVETYQRAKGQVERLQKLTTFKDSSGERVIQVEELDEIKSLLLDLTSLCSKNDGSENNPEHQRILANADAHEAVVRMLRIPLSRFPDPDGNGVFMREDLITECFTFLAKLCSNHPGNQTILFQHLELFLQFLTVNTVVGVCIKEIFLNNRTLCAQVSETQVRAIVNVIAEGFKYPHFIDILEVVCTQDGVPLRRNQKLVLKMLLEKQSDALVLFKDQDSQEQRNSLIQNEDYLNPNSLLYFHMKQLDLITSCAKGKIYESEAMCQSLFSIGDISQQLNDPNNLRAIKGHLVMLLDEVRVLTVHPT